MNAEEKANLLRDVTSQLRKQTHVDEESLASTTRMVDGLPEDVPTPDAVVKGVVGGLVLRWNLAKDTTAYLAMTAGSRMRGYIFHKRTTLAHFEQDASEGVKVSVEFMAAFRRALG